MKVLSEVLVKRHDSQKSHFTWLNNDSNWLYVIEDGKRMRTLNVDPGPCKELQSTTLTESRTCTSLSWNKDGTLLAIVVDKRLIYFWEIKTNNFTHFKPTNKILNSNVTLGKQNKAKEVESIQWSKLTNKFVICYSGGQLLLCNCDAEFSEKFIDSSEGVLTRVVSIGSCEHVDMFVCITVISELLVMTFDGESKFYVQRDDLNIIKAKLSPLASTRVFKAHGNGYSSDIDILWVAYQTHGDSLLFKRIAMQNYSSSETNSRSDLIYNSENVDSPLVDFHWLSSEHLITCFGSGTIELLHIRCTNSSDGQPMHLAITTDKLLNLDNEDEFSQGDNLTLAFKSFELMHCRSLVQKDMIETGQYVTNSSWSLAVLCDYRIFYYEIVEVNNRISFALEKVDDLDLTKSLTKLKLKLEQVRWSFDCSMLAAQLDNGHILVYRTKLTNYMVALHGSRTAYMSGANEITVLNYGLKRNQSIQDQEQQPSLQLEDFQREESGGDKIASIADNENALVITIEMRPTVIAVGPKHLAVALNNRIQFYSVSLTNVDENNQLKSNQKQLIDQQEYVSIVVGMSLNSRFVAVLFDDGRLKLHAIQSNSLMNEYESGSKSSYHQPAPGMANVQDLNETDERFFPDPSEPEQISAFILCENLLLYSTRQCNINVFSITDWSIIQSFHYSSTTNNPIIKIKANEQGNKFVCLSATCTNGPDNVFLYDLYTNQIIRFMEYNLFSRIFASQLVVHLLLPEAQFELNKLITSSNTTQSAMTTTTATDRSSVTTAKLPNLGQIVEAIWDADGRTVLLIEQKYIHTFTTLDHTLEREEALVCYVQSASKASTYTVLYASQGIVSFQTALGRVINSILDSHDDESKLVQLEQQIGLLRQNQLVKPMVPETDNELELEKLQVNSENDLFKMQAEVMSLKLNYLRSILPIYSLSRCKEIIEHLMQEDVFNPWPKEQRCVEIDQVIWRQLAAWSLFTMNLNFASLIYRKHGLMLSALVVREIIRDARNKRLDSRESVKTRLLVLLGCDI